MIDTSLRASSRCHGTRSGLEDATHLSEGGRSHCGGGELRISKYSHRNTKKCEGTNLMCVGHRCLLAERGLDRCFMWFWLQRKGRHTKLSS